MDGFLIFLSAAVEFVSVGSMEEGRKKNNMAPKIGNLFPYLINYMNSYLMYQQQQLTIVS